MSEEVTRIQEVKVAYFERFWGPSGKVVVRTLATAAAAAEVGLIPSSHPSFFLCLLLAKLFRLAQELIPDQPSEDNQTSEVRRSPSGRDAGGSSRAQV